MSRHYPPGIEEVWDSYEWLLKSKLEEIDYMARLMFQEMQFTRTDNNTIRDYMQERFAELWEYVASHEEENYKHRRVRK